MRAARLAPLAIAAAALMPGTAAAQRAREAATAARADSLHARAVALVATEDTADARHAIALLRREVRLRRAPRSLGAAWNVMGHAWRALGQLDSAEAAYRRALVVRREARDTAGEAASLNNLGTVRLDAGRPAEARAWFRRAYRVDSAAGLHAKAADVLRNVAVAWMEEGRADSAIAARRASIAHHEADTTDGRDARLREALLDLSLATFDAGSAAEALDVARRAALVPGGEADGGDLRARLAAARALVDLGHADSALAERRAVLALAAARPDSAALSVVTFDLGRQLRGAGQRDSASRYLGWSLAVDRASGSAASAAQTLVELARLDADGGRLPAAEARFAEALRLAREDGDPAREADVLARLGLVLDEYQRRDSARRVLAAGLDAARRAGSAAGEATLLVELSSTFLPGAGKADQPSRDSARVLARLAIDRARAAGDVANQVRALQLVAESFAHVPASDTAVHRRDSIDVAAGEALRLARGLGSRDLEFRVLSSRGTALFGIGEGAEAVAPLEEALAIARASGRDVDAAHLLEYLGVAYQARPVPDWARAAAYFDSAWVAAETIRRAMADDDARIAFAEAWVNTGRRLGMAWERVADATHDPAAEWMTFAASERARARSLLDRLDAAATARVATLAEEAAAHRAAARPPRRATLTLMHGGGTQTAWLLLPDGTLLRAARDIPGEVVRRQVAALRRALRVDSAVTRAAPVALEEGALEEGALEGTRGLGARAGGATGVSAPVAAAALAAVLIPDTVRRALLAADVDDLVIVPEGESSVVPFAALPVDSSGTPMGLRWRLRYAPSLAALRAAEARPATARGEVLVVGDPAMPVVRAASGDAVRLNPLPGAAREARAVARRLGARAMGDSAAREDIVKRRLADAAVVHLATHGYAYASETRARESFVALAPGGDDDGLLTVGEVLDAARPLAAELVVLSACQTALGQQTTTEGTIGLQRAFLARGARALLVSQWSVDDAVTQLLMERFYAHWRGRTTASEALRRAQADVRARHPDARYWAAFQLVGADVRRPATEETR